jgi:hypothetical protein
VIGYPYESKGKSMKMKIEDINAKTKSFYRIWIAWLVFLCLFGLASISFVVWIILKVMTHFGII